MANWPSLRDTDRTLKGSVSEAWRNMPPEWRGTDLLSPLDFHNFPLLVKFLFPTDQLSIQVHPRDAYARQNESPHARGKTEMWHVVSAQPGANLLLGLVPDADQRQFRMVLEIVLWRIYSSAGR